MKAVFNRIADAFEDPPAESTLADVALFDKKLGGKNGGGTFLPSFLWRAGVIRRVSSSGTAWI